jgi:bla regulator protein blaR1
MAENVIEVFTIILECSVQAAVLIVLVWGVHRFFGKTMTSFCKWCLWSVILARLLLPFSFNANIQLTEYFSESSFAENLLNKGSAVVNAFRQEMAYETPSNFTFHNGVFADVPRSERVNEDFFCAIAGVYLFIALFLFLFYIMRNRALRKMLLVSSRTVGGEIRKIFDNCRYASNVSDYVELRMTSLVASPTLVGYFRPVIFIPSEKNLKISPKDFNFIFLHELVHIKKKDALIISLMNIVRIIHWFNPFVHLLYSWVSNEREILCDEKVLELSGKESAHGYGSAIIKVMESAALLHLSPAGVGILNGKRFVRRRIVMIRDFGAYTVSYRARVMGALLTSVMLFWSFTSFASINNEGIDDLVRVHIKGVTDNRSFFEKRYLPSPQGHEIPYFNRRSEFFIKKDYSCKKSVMVFSLSK